MPETARLTADVVLIGHDAAGAPHVLLIKRRWDPYEGRWALPGGHVDQDEAAEDAARRELLEETGIGLGPHPLDLVQAYADPHRDPRGRYVTFAYTARVPDMPQPTAADDAAEAGWIPVAEIEWSRFAFDHARIVHDALARHGA